MVVIPRTKLFAGFGGQSIGRMRLDSTVALPRHHRVPMSGDLDVSFVL